MTSSAKLYVCRGAGSWSAGSGLGPTAKGTARSNHVFLDGNAARMLRHLRFRGTREGRWPILRGEEHREDRAGVK